MRRLQITVARLVVSTLLLGAGLGCLLAALTAAFNAEQSWPDSRKFTALLQYLSSGPLIGSALLTPFHRPRVGAYIGFLTGILGGIVGLMIWRGRWDWEMLWSFRYVIGLTLMAIALGVIGAARSGMVKLRS